MADVVCMGESVIDFTSLTPGASIADSPGFQKNAGGAPANVAVGVARLGGTSAFMGMMGDDEFGRYLAGVLDANKVDISGLRYTRQAHTALAFVALRKDGEREFMFYRNPGADQLYTADDIDKDMIAQCRIFCHGSTSMVDPANCHAILTAAELAKQSGALIVYDPNVRLNLWDRESLAREIISLGIPEADIIKLSEEELAFITGCVDVDAGIRSLRSQGPKVVIVTRGGEACHYSWGPYLGSVPATKVHVVDATGAGDAFLAGLLYQISLSATPVESYSEMDIRKMLTFSHAVAGLCVGFRGAIPAMPTLDQVKQVLG